MAAPPVALVSRVAQVLPLMLCRWTAIAQWVVISSGWRYVNGHGSSGNWQRSWSAGRPGIGPARHRDQMVHEETASWMLAAACLAVIPAAWAARSMSGRVMFAESPCWFDGSPHPQLAHMVVSFHQGLSCCVCHVPHFGAAVTARRRFG